MTTPLGKRLKTLRGTKSQAEFALLVGINVNTLRNYERGIRSPNADTIVSIAEKTRATFDWILSGHGPMLCGSGPRDRSDATPTSNGAYRQAAGEDFGLVLVKKVKARLAAGTGSLETDGAIKGLYSFREDWIASKGNPERMVLMEVLGDSMYPDIWSGDTVLIDESKKEIIAGGVYAVGIDDEVVVKYVEKLPGKLILRSKNHEEFPPIEVDMSDHLADSVRIIGRVIWWCREAR